MSLPGRAHPPEDSSECWEGEEGMPAVPALPAQGLSRVATAAGGDRRGSRNGLHVCPGSAQGLCLQDLGWTLIPGEPSVKIFL